jgi:predicted amidohydrolase
VYTLFCNNTGTGPAGRYYGGSCVFSPRGKPLVSAGTGSEVVTATLSAAEIESARKVRTHLADLRSDIDWS